jgi:hypothetical protein
VGDRNSGLKDKIDVKEKEELLVKKLKSCERNMQELTDSIKRQNLLHEHQRRIRGASQQGK